MVTNVSVGGIQVAGPPLVHDGQNQLLRYKDEYFLSVPLPITDMPMYTAAMSKKALHKPLDVGSGTEVYFFGVTSFA